jgi:pilus assembly protein CpaF
MSGPFAPTPLGGDWTPPGHATSRENPGDERPRSEQETEEADLGSLFGDAVTEESAERDGEESAMDLGALFDAGDESASNGGPEQAADETVQRSSVLIPAQTITPRTRRRSVGRPPVPQPPASSAKGPQENSGEYEVVSRPSSQGSPVNQESPVDEADSPAQLSIARESTPVVPADSRQLTTKERVKSTMEYRGYMAAFTYGRQELERLWQILDQVSLLMTSDTQLQEMSSRLTLTPDRETYQEQRQEVHSLLRNKMAMANISVGGLLPAEAVMDFIVDEATGISVLGEMFRDPSIDEILVDRWDTVSVERHGSLERTNVTFRDAQHAESVARLLARKVSDRAVSRTIPLVTAELPAARITFAFGAVVKGGLSITIRKFKSLLGLEDLLNYGSLNSEMVEFLRDAVQMRASVLVSGGTGTGKTTIVNLLSSFIPDTERVITIEDAFELKLANTHVVSLQTKEASSLDDTISVGLADLLRNTLRMRPDRIIVGEIREGAGAMVMLAAANTGHDGTITTIHANSPESALNERLPDLIRQERMGLDAAVVNRSVAGAFDLVLQVTRDRGGRRYISEISAVDGVDGASGQVRLVRVFKARDTGAGIVFERSALSAETELGRRLREGGAETWIK